MYWVYQIEWTEYEPGWGCRPDGKSYHASKEDADLYIASQRASASKSTSSDYSRPGTPNLVEVDKATFELVKRKKLVWAKN